MQKTDKQSILSRISDITETLEWIKKYKPEQYQQKFLQLVPLRCELRKILLAEDENPAIAAYGESQKGKSYLMGNLLQKNGAPFMVHADGKEYDFVASINPIGDKREATGVVTRFTSYMGHEDRASEKYPARMKVMSVANVVTILADGYFNDVLDDKRYSDNEIQERADAIYNKYVNREDIQDILSEDDVIDIKLYLSQFVNTSKISAFCQSTDFFNKVALVIRKVPQNEWVDIFSVLWHDNRDLTELFVRLLRCLQRLNFARVVYLPVEALLHKGENRQTIMSVQCLNGLYSRENPQYSDVFVKTDSGDFKCLSSFDKSELSALCLEVSFKVDVKYLDDSASFYYDKENSGKPGYMSSDTFTKLTQDGNYVSKRKLLEVSDLLDFPGAKNREQIKEETLDRYDQETQQANIVKLFLRGKVSFLFNYFSDSKALNILMFCHNAEDVKVTQMYNVIDKWIRSYVGDTVEKRRKTMQLSGNIAPFFAIGTMFNIDMVRKSNPEANSPASLRSRWNGRFSTVLYQDCFHAGTDVEWFKNWTDNGVAFQNIYVLRDFKYSGCDGQGNNLYKGYDEASGKLSETSLALPPDFYETIRESFVSDTNNVGRFFSDPKLAWDVVATMNNDGSLYIIKQLCTAAQHMAEVRNNQFSQRIEEITGILLDKIKDYYETEGNDDKLDKHVDMAFQVLREFDIASSDNAFFGKMMDALQISDDEAYNAVHDIIESPSLVTKGNEFSEYELIMKRIGQCSSINEVLASYARTYHYPSPEAAGAFLEEKGIDPANLVYSGNSLKHKNSYIISEFLLESWKTKLTSSALLSKITSGSSFDLGIMSNIITNLLDMMEVTDINSKMAEAISEIVDVVAIGTANEFLVADILRHYVNTFVTDMGYSLLSNESASNINIVADGMNFPLSGSINCPDKSEYTEEELTDMFMQLSIKNDAISPSFDRHYGAWLEYMFLSFIATAGKITVIANPEANNAIGSIISRLR